MTETGPQTMQTEPERTQTTQGTPRRAQTEPLRREPRTEPQTAQMQRPQMPQMTERALPAI